MKSVTAMLRRALYEASSASHGLVSALAAEELPLRQRLLQRLAGLIEQASQTRPDPLEPLLVAALAPLLEAAQQGEPNANALIGLLESGRPEALRLCRIAIEDLWLRSRPERGRLIDCYRRQLRALVLVDGRILPPWPQIAPLLERLFGQLLPISLRRDPQLQALLPTSEELDLLDHLRQQAGDSVAAAFVAGGDEVLAQSIIAEGGAMIHGVQQTVVYGDYLAVASAEPADLIALYQHYRTFLSEHFATLDFRGLMQRRTSPRLPLEAIYIPLQASDQEAQTAPIHHFVRDNPCLLVLGHPGAGKSTLVRYLLLALASGQAEPLLGLEGAWLPIFFPVAAFAEARSRQQRPDLAPLDYLAEYYGGFSQPDYGALFYRALACGQALVLIDGLDEVRRERTAIAQTLEAFVREWDVAGNRFIATSRIAGYEDAPLNPRLFSQITIQPLSDAAIRNFIDRWCRSTAGASLDEHASAVALAEAERRAASHAEQLQAAVFAETGVTDLARTPLLLTILALIHHGQGARLPNRRAELYRLCVETLAETWNRARSLSGRAVEVALRGEPLGERFVINLLGPVALFLHSEHPGGVIEQDELEALLAETLARSDGLSHGVALRTAQAFVELARRDTGLLHERGYRRFGFLHLTFEEYLAARALVDSVTIDAPERQLATYASEPRWQEVIRLALASASQREAPRLLNALLIAPSHGEQYGRPILLAAICLADLGRNHATGSAWEAVVSALQRLVHEPLATTAIRQEAAAHLLQLEH